MILPRQSVGVRLRTQRPWQLRRPRPAGPGRRRPMPHPLRQHRQPPAGAPTRAPPPCHQRRLPRLPGLARTPPLLARQRRCQRCCARRSVAAIGMCPRPVIRACKPESAKVSVAVALGRRAAYLGDGYRRQEQTALARRGHLLRGLAGRRPNLVGLLMQAVGPCQVIRQRHCA
jgi:hypothetical protein